MCLQLDENDEFLKEDTHKNFTSLRSVHSCEEEARCLPQGEGSYWKCWLALKYLLWVTDSLFNVQPLFHKALYQVLLGEEEGHDDLLCDLALTKQEAHSIWPWVAGLKCLTNTEASLTWLVIWGAHWISKKLCSAGLAKSPNCSPSCGDVETLAHAFHCRVICPLCKFIEDIVVHMLFKKFFVLEARSIFSNIVPQLTKAEHYVFFCLLGIM